MGFRIANPYIQLIGICNPDELMLLWRWEVGTARENRAAHWGRRGGFGGC